METLGIVGLTTLMGYYFKNTTHTSKLDKVYNTITEMPELEKPNGPNIYSSGNKVKAINDSLLEMNLSHYDKSNNPSDTGILPPIFNSYSSIGNPAILEGKGFPTPSSHQMSAIDATSRISNVFGVNSNYSGEKYVATKPMFNEDFGNTKITDQHTTPFMANDTNTHSLTGLPLEKTHQNQQPFFGSNKKQSTNINTHESLLDNFTGQTYNFKHKKELDPFFELYKEDIYGTPLITDTIEQDRYTPSVSVFRQNERPFDQQHINAPISWSDNDITAAAADNKNIDSLYKTANRPQISYAAKKNTGQLGSVRGYQAPVKKNKTPRESKLTQSRLLTNTSTNIKHKATENYTAMPNTARQSLNTQPLRNPRNEQQKHSQRIAKMPINSIDSKNTSDSYSQNPKRQTFLNKYNGGGIDGEKSFFFNKNEYRMPELERDTSNTPQQLNVHLDKAFTSKYSDIMRPTQKESYVDNKYQGVANGPEQPMDHLQYTNIAISDKKQIAVMGQRPGGSQKRNIPGGKVVTGKQKIKPNMLLKEEENTRIKTIAPINGNTIIPNTTTQGINQNKYRNPVELENTRETLDFSNLIALQLKSNPYYNLNN